MKKKHLLIIASLVLITVTSCNSNAPKEEKQTSDDPKASSTTAIDGAWDLVWAKYNDTIVTINRSSQFKQFSNGFFSLMAWDTSGKFDYCGYGKYELDGNVYKETFLYHNNQKYVGAMDWQEYELKGDTLYIKGFTKVIVGGKEVTASFPKVEEKRVRAK